MPTSLRPPPLVDVALAAGLTILGLAQLWHEGAGAAAVAAVVAMTAPVAVRRTLPLAAVAVSWTALFVGDGLGSDVTSQGYAAIFALWLTVYSVARHGQSPAPLSGLVWALSCTWGSVLARSGLDLPSLVLTAIITFAPWLAGAVVRREQVRREAAERAAEAATTAAEQEARQAVAEERTRIAREVHDVLGHTLGLMVLQLGAADRALHNDPAAARAALRSARDCGKSALAEVRYLIGLDGVTEEREHGVPAPPVPGLTDIPALVETAREAGVDVRLDVQGPLAPLDAATDLAAYRIVQESLTNATRHGSGPVAVSVRPGASEVLLTITNPMASHPGGTNGQAVNGHGRNPHGRGLIGMHERARSLGGSLSAAGVDGTFRVEARLPLGAVS